MKLGLGLPHLGVDATRQKIVEFAQRAEAVGFDSLWVLERGSQRLGSTHAGHQHSGKRTVENARDCPRDLPQWSDSRRTRGAASRTLDLLAEARPGLRFVGAIPEQYPQISQRSRR